MRGIFGRPRPKTQGQTCPKCDRILIPTRIHQLPPHFDGIKLPEQSVWCDRGAWV